MDKKQRIDTNKRQLIKNIIKTFVIMVLTTLLALALDELSLRAENILMLYAVAVLIIITETKGFAWGAVSAVLCVFTFNFFFTDPRLTFRVNDPNYFVSFGIFLVVAFIVSTLTTRLNNQIVLSKQNEERTSKLYKISSGYLNVTGAQEIISYGEKSLSDLIHKKCTIYMKLDTMEFTDSAVSWSYSNSFACGFGESYLDKLSTKYLPIKSGRKTIGVLAVELQGVDITTEEMLCINTMLNQITIAWENDSLRKAERIKNFDTNEVDDFHIREKE